MSIDSTEENVVVDNVLMESVDESFEPVENNEAVPDGDVLGRRRRSSVIEDISILCSDCRAMKQKCRECAKLLKSQESLRRLSRTESADSGLVGSFTSEKRSVTKKVGKLNGIRDLSQESSTAEWLNHNGDVTGDNTSHEKLCNMNEVEEKHDMCADSIREKNKQCCDINNDGEKCNGDLNDCYGDITSPQVKVFPSGKSDKRDFTRQEKVGYWLHSLSQTKRMDNDGIRSDSQEEEANRLKLDAGNKERHATECKQAGKYDKENISEVNTGSRSSCENYRKSSKGSVGDEEVFFSADESPKHVAGKSSPERPMSLNLLRKVTTGIRGSNKTQNVGPSERLASGGSEDSSGKTRPSVSEIHVNKHDPGMFTI
jgi:hypothetical protein